MRLRPGFPSFHHARSPSPCLRGTAQQLKDTEPSDVLSRLQVGFLAFMLGHLECNSSTGSHWVSAF